MARHQRYVDPTVETVEGILFGDKSYCFDPDDRLRFFSGFTGHPAVRC